MFTDTPTHAYHRHVHFLFQMRDAHEIRVKLTNRESNHWKGNFYTRNFVFITRWVIGKRIDWIDFDRTGKQQTQCAWFSQCATYLSWFVCLFLFFVRCKVREISCERIVWLHDYTFIFQHMISFTFDFTPIHGIWLEEMKQHTWLAYTFSILGIEFRWNPWVNNFLLLPRI